MTLHENSNLFEEAVVAAAQRMNIPEIFIEKDYWVTFVLKTIFSSELAKEVVFKGGTSLSKCYKIIQRFSEDIDLVVLKNSGENDNQLKRKIKALGTAVSTAIPEIEIEGITHKRGTIRKTAHTYTKKGFAGTRGQVREHIILEATWLGNPEPYTIAYVDSFISDMMKLTGQAAMIKEFGLESFKVKVLSKERTLCEKIMSLVRFSHTQQPHSDLSNKIRHIYDIHMMFMKKEVLQFFDSPEFEKMLIIVGSDDMNSFRNNNAWLKIHPKAALIFTDVTSTWNAIRQPYRTTFRDLVIGELPKEEELILTLNRIAKRLRSISWELNSELIKV